VTYIEEQLRLGRFDVIVFGDLLELTDREAVLRLVNANPKVPLFVVDTQDDGYDSLPRILAYLGRDAVHGQFKREMLACVAYSPGTYPLPLAYPDDRVAHDIAGQRPDDVFWAGHRCWGLRRLYLDHIEARLGRSLDQRYTPDEYRAALDRAQIGLDIFGLGYDTVRYWETPARGCMLLAERRPIRIPLDFEDGESAVFFDDLPDLEQKLDYYLAHPDETRAIAVRGHDHLRRYHTGSARARQFLGRIQTLE